MFEQSLDVLLQQVYPSTAPLSPSTLPSLFKPIHTPHLLKCLKDSSSMSYYKEKTLEFEKLLTNDPLQDLSKLLYPLIAFSKVFSVFTKSQTPLESDLKGVLESNLTAFPSELFLKTFKALERPETNEFFFEEVGQFLLEFDLSLQRSSFPIGVSSCVKLFSGLLNLVFPLEIDRPFYWLDQKPGFYKYIGNILCFLFARIEEENDNKALLEELFIRLELNEKQGVSIGEIALELKEQISLTSYFLMKVPLAYLFVRNDWLKARPFESIKEWFAFSLKLIQKILILLFKKARVDIKGKTGTSRFLKVFLKEILIGLENPELAPSANYYRQAFCNLILESLNQIKPETECFYKSLMLDFIKILLLHLLETRDFIESKTQKLLIEQEPNTIIDKNLSLCSKCHCLLQEEDLKATSFDKTALCLLCLIAYIKESLNLPQKPEFSLIKLTKTPYNPIFLHFQIQCFNLNNQNTLPARQFLLCDWSKQLSSFTKAYLPSIKALLEANTPISSIPAFLKAYPNSPNDIFLRYINLSLWDLTKLLKVFYSLLLLLSNEGISIRNKVLEILQGLIQKVPEIAFEKKVMEIISQRVLDSSINVRTMAIGVIMRLYEHNGLEDSMYFGLMLERLGDVDSGLRKKILCFFLTNTSKIKSSDSLRKQALIASIYRIYDNEEIALIALKVAVVLIFETGRKIKGNNKEIMKNKGKNENIKNFSLSKSLKVCRELCVELKNWEWLNKVVKYSAFSEDMALDSKEIESFMSLAITELTLDNEINDKIKAKMLKEEDLANLELLLAFSKHYSVFLSKELGFLTHYLQYLYGLIKQNPSDIVKTPIKQVTPLRKPALLLLLDILDCFLKDKKEFFNPIIKQFEDIEQVLLKLIQEEALEVLHKALKLLIASVRSITENYFIIKNLFIQTYAFVLQRKLIAIKAENTESLQLFMRCLYILTFLIRYFDISLFFDENERLLPDYQESSLIKMISKELILFCDVRSNLIEIACLECVMVLWEKLPTLIFETRGFIERYLTHVSNENTSEILEKLYSGFLNLLLRHEEGIRRQNSLKRRLKGKKTFKKKVSLEKSTVLENESSIETSSESEICHFEVLEDKEFELLTSIITEMTRTTFVLHIFNPEARLRKVLLHLLEALLTQGHLSSYELDEYFLCFLTDSDEEIRAFCTSVLKQELRNSRMNLFGAFNKGIRKGFLYLLQRQTRPFPFIASEQRVLSLYSGLAEALRIGKEVGNSFPGLLMENYVLYTVKEDKEFSLYVCVILLSLGEYTGKELLEVFEKLFAVITKNYYKSIQLLRLLAGKTEEKRSRNVTPIKTYSVSKEINTLEEKEGFNKESIGTKEDLSNCFVLLIQLITFHLLIRYCKFNKDISFTSLKEFLERFEKIVHKEDKSEKKVALSFAIEIKGEILTDLYEFVEKYLVFEFYWKNKENIYLLYKKTKFLFNGESSFEYNEGLFSLDSEMLEKQKIMLSNRKSKGKKQKGRVSKVKANELVIVDEVKTNIFSEKTNKTTKTKKIKQEERKKKPIDPGHKRELRARKILNLNEEND